MSFSFTDDEREQHKTLENMVLLGVTMNGVDYVRNTDTNQLLPTVQPPWRPARNGNPPDMLTVARALLESEPILFVVERDTNRNVVLYTLRDEDVLPVWLMIPNPPVHYDSEMPLDADTEIDLGDVHTETLTPLEAAFGYGVHRGVQRGANMTLFVQALKEQPIVVRKVDNEWHAFIQITADSAPLILRRIMIHTEPRPLAPWPKVVEIHLEVQQEPNSDSIWYRYGVY